MIAKIDPIQAIRNNMYQKQPLKELIIHKPKSKFELILKNEICKKQPGH